ncbi:hypothetical protein [Bauldia litoralis]|nr:hypothetical protein [Bauldia litoralis]
MTTDRIIGAFVFPDAWSDLEVFRALLAEFQRFGVSAIVTETDTYCAAAIDAVHERGMQFFAGIACFSDHASNFKTLAARPELRPVLENGEPRSQMEWYVGITPTDRRHQESVLNKIRLIAASNEIDGLFLDFVRWPLHWELELRPGQEPPMDSSFDEATLEIFAEATRLRPPSSRRAVADRAAWILGSHRTEWVNFKCQVITSFVHEARAALLDARRRSKLGAFLVPDGALTSESFTGQRWEDLVPLIDWAAPMLYHNILLQPPAWIGQMVDHAVSMAGSKTLPVLQADSNRDPAVAADWGPPMDIDNWRAALTEVAGRDDIAGLVVFPGPGLLEDGRGEALRDAMSAT